MLTAFHANESGIIDAIDPVVQLAVVVERFLHAHAAARDYGLQTQRGWMNDGPRLTNYFVTDASRLQGGPLSLGQSVHEPANAALDGQSNDILIDF